jgi:monoamine oxidase
MAAQAKAVTTFGEAFWRSAGHSGNAFVRHPQAVLAEVYDCSASAKAAAAPPGALGGFVALNAAQRPHFQRGLPLLIASQLGQLYGAQAQDGALFLQDWATEPWTCSAADRSQPPQPPQCDPLLRQPLWGGRLLLGGSETAAHGAGHMEGALESADRVLHALLRARAGPLQPAAASGACAAGAGAPNSRAAAIGAFSASVLGLRTRAPERYRLHLTRLLQARQSEQLTQRALLATAEQCYSEALAGLDALLPAMDTANAQVQNGRHALSAALLAPFEGWNKALLESALGFNAGSCAVSNFPQEHQPDAASLRAITLDLAAAWREFALELNSRLLVALPA